MDPVALLVAFGVIGAALGLLIARRMNQRADEDARELRAWFEAALPHCRHHSAVPVTLLADGEIVAWWCPACEMQLTADCALKTREGQA